MTKDSMEETWFDSDGQQTTLDALCRKEPAWAANRIRAEIARAEQLQDAVDAAEGARDDDGSESECEHQWFDVTLIVHPKTGWDTMVQVCRKCGQGRMINEEPPDSEWFHCEIIGKDCDPKVHISPPIHASKIVAAGLEEVGGCDRYSCCVSREQVPWAWARCPDGDCPSGLLKAGSQLVTSKGMVLRANFRCDVCGRFFEARYNGVRMIVDDGEEW